MTIKQSELESYIRITTQLADAINNNLIQKIVIDNDAIDDAKQNQTNLLNSAEAYENYKKLDDIDFILWLSNLNEKELLSIIKENYFPTTKSKKKNNLIKTIVNGFKYQSKDVFLDYETPKNQEINSSDDHKPK